MQNIICVMLGAMILGLSFMILFFNRGMAIVEKENDKLEKENFEKDARISDLMSEIEIMRQILKNKKEEVKDLNEYKRRIDVAENNYNVLLHKHKMLLKIAENDKIEKI